MSLSLIYSVALARSSKSPIKCNMFSCKKQVNMEGSMLILSIISSATNSCWGLEKMRTVEKKGTDRWKIVRLLGCRRGDLIYGNALWKINRYVCCREFCPGHGREIDTNRGYQEY
jgi:hypothetical protein